MSRKERELANLTSVNLRCHFKTLTRDFPGGPAVKTVLPLPRVLGRALVGKVLCAAQCGQKKIDANQAPDRPRHTGIPHESS